MYIYIYTCYMFASSTFKSGPPDSRREPLRERHGDGTWPADLLYDIHLCISTKQCLQHLIKHRYTVF